MAWRGFSKDNIPSSDEKLNFQPDIKQEAENYSNVVSDKLQSADSGNIKSTEENVGGIPKVGIYKKVNAIRRDTDNQRNFSVTLEDIDKTIINYMNQRLNLAVMDNGSLIKVPVIYASPEKWVSMKRDGYLKDNQGKLLLPLILIKRNEVTNNRELMTLNRYLTYPVEVKYSQKNKYDRFDLLCKVSNDRPVKQIFNVKLPDHVLINYDCIIWTDYNEDANRLLEIINFATHDYWGLDGFRFRTKIESYNIDFEDNIDNDRSVRCTFKLDVYAYLLPETIDGVKDTTTKTITNRKIVTDISVNENLDKNNK